MKSVTIRDRKTDEILVKIIHRKDGRVDSLTHANMDGRLKIQIRDDQNCLITFYPERSE